jgi:glycosyltransferase involved in cell wall biosynthesis
MWCGSKGHNKVKGYRDILLPLKIKLAIKGIELDLKLTNSMSKHNLNPQQMCAWYNSGQVYVVASKNEGTPNPAIEAASCGCPVVSTHVGNMPELIKDGYNGYLCDRTVQSLYDGIMKTFDNIEPMSNNMLKEIEPWDWKVRSTRFYDLFRKVIKSM